MVQVPRRRAILALCVTCVLALFWRLSCVGRETEASLDNFLDKSIYPVPDYEEGVPSPDIGHIISIFHDAQTLSVLMQGLGGIGIEKSQEGNITSCMIGDQALPFQQFAHFALECYIPKDYNLANAHGQTVTVSTDAPSAKVMAAPYKFDISRTAPPPVQADAKHRLCVATEFYNETNYIADWMEFHKALGVSYFFLFDNDSQDNPRAFLKNQVWADGHYKVFDFPWSKAQDQAFATGKLYSERLCDWTLFIDIDEYMFPKSCTPKDGRLDHCLVDAITSTVTLSATERQLDESEIGQVSFRAKTFGSSGIVERPQSGTVPEHYIHRKFLNDGWAEQPKTAVRTRFATLRNTIHFFAMHPRHQVRVTAKEAETYQVHYTLKSWEDFMVKYMRPRVAGVKDWQLPAGLTEPLSPHVAPKYWIEKGYFVPNATVLDTAFRDWKASVQHMISVEMH